MKILHYIDRFLHSVGGPVTAVRDLATYLAARDHDVIVATRDDTDVPAPWRSPTRSPRSVRVDPRPLPLGRLSPQALAQITQLLGDADLLHLHGVWETCNLQLGRLAERMRKPYFLSVRGMLDDWSMAQSAVKKRAYLAVAGTRMLERATAVHLTAQAELDQARKWFPRGRGVVIPNLLDLSPYRIMPGTKEAIEAFPVLASGAPMLLFLSRIHHKKGVERLLDALPLLDALQPDDAAEFPEPAHVIVAGAGDDAYVASLKQRAASLGIDQRVHFVGQVIGRLKLSLYQACHAFVLPTSQENFGFVFFEALAAGLPVVTTTGVDTWPELKASGGAEIVEPNPADIAHAVATILASTDKRKRMGWTGRAWTFRELHPNRVVGQFEDLYMSALGADAGQLGATA